MYLYSNCSIRLSSSSTSTTSSCEIIFTHFQNINAEAHGGAVYFANENIDFYCSHCHFDKTRVVNGKYEAGGIYLILAHNATVRCSLFTENYAYWSNALYISIRLSPSKRFPISIHYICEDNIYPITNECDTHLDILGGDPLSFLHSNISNIVCTESGFYLDFCEVEKFGVFSFINFADIIENAYFRFDQEILPENVYYDHINMKNISATEFYGVRCLERKASFYYCNIITEHQKINSNIPVKFINCYSMAQFIGKSEVMSPVSEINQIMIQSQICSLNKFEIPSYNQYIMNTKLVISFLSILTSILLLSPS